MSIRARSVFPFVAGLALVACAPIPDAPARQVSEAAIGDPSHTDVECTAARLAVGDCDFVVVHDDMPINGLFYPDGVWFQGSQILGMSAPTIFERGFRPASTTEPARRTIRIWAMQMNSLWNTICGGTTDPCGFAAGYQQASGMYPGTLGIEYRRRVTDGPIGIEVYYTMENDETRIVADVFAVAYAGPSSYGTTVKARRLEMYVPDPSELGYYRLDPYGGLFSASYPTWTAD